MEGVARLRLRPPHSVCSSAPVRVRSFLHIQPPGKQNLRVYVCTFVANQQGCIV
ncbi:hypothetical protein BDZ91DRAFT_718116 [Kalaharituber pfeilii]|nr:hypothetical protein BDZ91DRAFT_718116 [Kalaharituber pfeilii]